MKFTKVLMVIAFLVVIGANVIPIITGGKGTATPNKPGPKDDAITQDYG